MKTYLPGPVVCGFYDCFEADYGDPETPKPYARVTPSRVGKALLPFHCPSCGQVVDFTDSERLAAYRDDRNKARVNYFCPSCGARFYLNEAGREFSGSLDSDGAAPSVVERIVRGPDGVDVVRERQGEATVLGWVRQHYLAGCDVLGCG